MAHHPAGQNKANCLPRLRCFMVAGVVLAPCGALGLLLAERGEGLQAILASCGDSTYQEWYPVLETWQAVAVAVSLLVCLPAAGAVALLLARPWTRHLRLAGFYSLLLFAHAVAQCTAQVTLCNFIEDRDIVLAVLIVCAWVQMTTFTLALLIFQILVYYRVLALEEIMQTDVGTARLRKLLRMQGATGVLGILFFSLADLIHALGSKGIAFFSNVGGALVTVISFGLALRCMCYSVRAFSTPLRLLREQNIAAPCLAVRRAISVASLQRYAIIFAYATSTLVIVIFVAQFIRHKYTAHILFAQAMVACLDILANAFGVVVTSGVLQAKSQTYDAAVYERQRALRRRDFGSKWLANPDQRWQDAVEELAHRAVSLRALLDFYGGLPNLMPHYDPRVHTTCDVVRSAIIPFTAERGVPCSAVMMDGRTLLPGTMVTHTWSGLFSELVGSIAAHALSESCSDIVTELMVTDLDALRGLLEQAGKLEDTFWVCAFCVNQHTSICHSVGSGEVDLVTQQPHRRCWCACPKHHNRAEPVREDGKSIPCEMNKFGDMISFLACKESDFQHLIIVDPAANVFTRAWCMKEAAEGYDAGIGQTVLVKSPQVLAQSYERLAQTRIEDMQASRAEDIEEILRSIPDTVAFNRALQELIFSTSGLLGKLLAGDTAMQMSRIGWIARWLPLVDKADPSVQGHFIQRLGVDDGVSADAHQQGAGKEDLGSWRQLCRVCQLHRN